MPTDNLSGALEALRLCREIVNDELISFIDGNGEPTKKGPKLDRLGLTGYELRELERLECALAAADAVLGDSL